MDHESKQVLAEVLKEVVQAKLLMEGVFNSMPMTSAMADVVFDAKYRLGVAGLKITELLAKVL